MHFENRTWILLPSKRASSQPPLIAGKIVSNHLCFEQFQHLVLTGGHILTARPKRIVVEIGVNWMWTRSKRSVNELGGRRRCEISVFDIINSINPNPFIVRSSPNNKISSIFGPRSVSSRKHVTTSLSPGSSALTGARPVCVCLLSWLVSPAIIIAGAPGVDSDRFFLHGMFGSATCVHGSATACCC